MKNEEFERYFLQYKNLVMRVVMDKTGDYQLAQEICQQVFIGYYRNMDRIAPELVKAWLMRCTQNSIVDYYRKKQHRAEISLEEYIVTEEGNLLLEESVEVYEENRSKSELIKRILTELKAENEKWYEVLELGCVEGLSYPEMAERLHTSTVVLRTRMHRARMFIRERFGEEFKS